MSDPSTIPYAGVDSQSVIDQSHLKALAICHYVWGGLVALISCVFIVHIMMGIAMASGKMSPATAGANAPPSWFGWVIIALGGFGLLAGWTFGILNIVSGHSMTRRRRRLLSLIVAGVNCASIPFGTILGVFTFIVLFRESVKGMYRTPQ